MKVLLVWALALVSFQVLEALPQTVNVPKKNPTDLRAVCGQPNPPATSKIIGSWEAGVHELPWQVALWKDEAVLCGGSLISDQWILTAAHCADGTGMYRIWLGAHNVHQVEDFRIEVVVNTDAENNVVHPGWNPNTHKDDIALIKLPAPVELSDIIRPICLPPANEADQHVGEVEIVSGWGRPSVDNIALISSELRKTNVTVIANTACSDVYGDIITNDHICVSTQDGHGTCTCDTGGPLSQVREDGAYVQIGIISFAHITGCDTGYPAGFSRVSNYVEWISEVTGLAI